MAGANVFANNVNRAMIHEKTREDGKKFFSVSVETDKSKSGMATYSVNEGQILDKKDKEGNVVAEHYCNILLGKPEATRSLSVAVGRKNKEGKYTKFDTIEVTNAEVSKMHRDAQKAYQASVKGAMKAERAGASKKAAEASVAEPAAEAEQEIQK